MQSIALGITAAACVVLLAGANAAPTDIVIQTQSSVATVPPRYLSVTLDASGFERGWTRVAPFGDPRLLALSEALSPAILRVSGTEADYLYYEFPGDSTTRDSGERRLESVDPRPVVGVNKTAFDWLTGLAKQSGWDMVFGVSMLNRTADDVWRPESVRGLLEYTRDQGIVVGFELGNEPDLDDRGKTSFVINPLTVAADFASMTSLLAEVYYGEGNGPPQADNASSAYPLLAGCDVADSLDFLANFSQQLVADSPSPSRPISALTWHHYYGDGSKMTVSDFVDPKVLDKVREPIVQAEAAAKAMPGGLEQTQVWIGESGSSYDGGTPGVSDRFVSIFWWLDQLGYAAIHGHSAVCRQCFIGGSYTLVEPQPSLFPNSDFWAAVLFKRLVGGRQLAVQGQEEDGQTLRSYAACTRTAGTADAEGVTGAGVYPSGSVTALLLNVRNETTVVSVGGQDRRRIDARAGGPSTTSDWELYQLTAPGGNISSKVIQLNGQILSTGPNGTLPLLSPAPIPAGQPLQLPPYSASFVVLTDAAAPACE